MTVHGIINGLLVTALLSVTAFAEPEKVDSAVTDSPAAEEAVVESVETDANEGDSAAVETDETAVNESDRTAMDKDTAAPPKRNKKDIVVVKENLDTVFIFDKSVFRHVAHDWRNNIDIFRQRGYGASGSSYHGANAVYIKPVEELVGNLPSLAGKKFSFGKFGFEPFLMSGGGGYVGLGDGFRLGGAGMSGERKFSSALFGGDSILVLNTKVSYGGVLIEKCILRNKWNISFGGLLGGGSIKVAVTEQPNTFFYGEDTDPADFDYQYNHRASCFMVEPHAGVTYSFFYFFHLGARISLPTFMSLDKFGIYTNDFISVNPGLHLNLTFGNLG